MYTSQILRDLNIKAPDELLNLSTTTFRNFFIINKAIL